MLTTACVAKGGGSKGGGTGEPSGKLMEPRGVLRKIGEYWGC